MQVSIALAEFPCSPSRVLDLGSGPGPASAAVIDAAPPGAPVERLVLVDGSRKALDLAASIIGRGGRRPASLSTALLDLESGAELPEGLFDLIVIGHCLNELWKNEADALRRRAEFVERASRRLSPVGRILLVEPALLATCRGLIGLRDLLAARSWRVLGPCPGSYPCPALAAGSERSCHAESPWEAPEPVASLARVAGLDRTAVKFAFFSLSPPTRAGTPPEERASGNRRVVSDPMLNKAGRLRFMLCGDGGLETLSARADDASARARGFMGLRRGDIVRASALEPRQGSGFGLLPGSELEILSRAPEASPKKEPT
jgi:SAM-dependent methyltransferase